VKTPPFFLCAINLLLLIAVVIDLLVLMRRIQGRPVLPAHHWLFGSAHTQKRITRCASVSDSLPSARHNRRNTDDVRVGLRH
jgi:hypothetical protein